MPFEMLINLQISVRIFLILFDGYLNIEYSYIMAKVI